MQRIEIFHSNGITKKAASMAFMILRCRAGNTGGSDEL